MEQTLRERAKKAEITLLAQQLPKAGTVSFTRQQEPLGLGHAVWCAREIVGDEPFALLLPDMTDHEGRQGLHEGHDRPLRPERRQYHRRRGMRARPSA
ncbi:hypothetical protein ACOJBO_25440 [Rhizobium beringeri]